MQQPFKHTLKYLEQEMKAVRKCFLCQKKLLKVYIAKNGSDACRKCSRKSLGLAGR